MAFKISGVIKLEREYGGKKMLQFWMQYIYIYIMISQKTTSVLALSILVY